MIAVLTGDIVASRKLINQEKWLSPLKELFNSWGKRPINWDLERGDFFQVEIPNPAEALVRALEIKALIKKVESVDERKKISTIDVRIAIGIGDKTYSGETIFESNGPAFIYSGEKFDMLKKQNTTIGVKTPWRDFDEDMNLFLKLAGILIDKWSISSAELMALTLKNPSLTQEEIGKKLGIKQSGVSRRWNRAHVSEILDVNSVFQKKIMNFVK
jgi:hypothetical protein